jgi:hypothetical protein
VSVHQGHDERICSGSGRGTGHNTTPEDAEGQGSNCRHQAQPGEDVTNPQRRVGAAWSATEWLTATAGIAAAVQSANPGAVVIANGLANEAKYFSTTGATSELLAPTAAAMAELWLRRLVLAPRSSRR